MRTRGKIVREIAFAVEEKRNAAGEIAFAVEEKQNAAGEISFPVEEPSKVLTGNRFSSLALGGFRARVSGRAES